MYQIDHIGIAVAELTPAIELYSTIFGMSVGEREVIPSQGVELVFLSPTGKSSATSVELLAPTEESSPLAPFLSNRGPGLHHIGYRVDNIVRELARLEKLEFQLIDKTPRPGARNSMIAFVHPKSVQGVLTELCEYRQP